MAAFPPNFPKEDALKILKNFAEGNKEGTGSAHIKNGKFIINKWPYSLYKVIRHNLPLLSHMPHPGWTLVHLRAASNGGLTYQNTHPFIKGDWAFCHNGIWCDYKIVKAAYSNLFKFKGQTDSEVAAQLFASIGPQKFIKSIESGVYLALHITGKMYAICNEFADLDIVKLQYGYLIASELPKDLKATKIKKGWIDFNSRGQIFKKAYSKDVYGGLYGKGRGIILNDRELAALDKIDGFNVKENYYGSF